MAMNFKPALVLLMTTLFVGCNNNNDPVNPVYVEYYRSEYDY